MMLLKKCLPFAILILHEIGCWAFALFTFLQPQYSVFMIPVAMYYLIMPYSCFHLFFRLTTFHVFTILLYSILIVPSAFLQKQNNETLPDFTITSSILASSLNFIFVFIFVRVQKIYPFYTYHSIPDLGNQHV